MPTNYTDVEAVKGIVEVDDSLYDDDALQSFVDAAAWLVQDVVLPGYANLTAPSNAKLEVIHRYLAAHMYSVTDPRSISEWVGTVRTFYEYKVDLHLNLTRFGQQAILLDTSGALAAYNNQLKRATVNLPAEKITVGVMWLGTEKTCPGG